MPLSIQIEDGLEKLRCFIVEDKVERAKEVVSQYQAKLSSYFGRSGNRHLSGVELDEVGTALIPRDTFAGYVALRTTGDGNCMFNVASIWLVGNESLSDVIWLLVAGELFFFPDYYLQTIKDRLMEVENSIPYSEATVFSTILTEAGEKEMTNSKNRVEAVRAEARNTCIRDNWNGMIQMLALATVLRRPVFSIYPEANPGLRPVFHWKILPL